MRIIIEFSNDQRVKARARVGDIFLIVRDDDNGLSIKEQYECTAVGEFKRLSDSDMEKKITQAEKLNVEVIAHSSSGSKQFQSEPTEQYKKTQNIPVDKFTYWLENSLLKHETKRTSVSLIACQAAKGTERFPEIAAQMLKFFHVKPKKITAREGYIYVQPDHELFSLGPISTAMHEAARKGVKSVEKKHTLEDYGTSFLRGLDGILRATGFGSDKSTPLNEKYAYFEGINGEDMKIDKQLYDLYRYSVDRREKPLQTMLAKDFIALAKQGILSDPSSKLYKKSKLVLNNLRSIKPAESMQINMDSYKTKDILLAIIDDIELQIASKKGVKSIDELRIILNETKEFIKYRQARNYPIDEFIPLMELLYKAADNYGHLNQQDAAHIKAFATRIQHEKQIESDVTERTSPSGLRPPSHTKAVREVTTMKNKAYSEVISGVLKTKEEQHVLSASKPKSEASIDISIDQLRAECSKIRLALEEENKFWQDDNMQMSCVLLSDAVQNIHDYESLFKVRQKYQQQLILLHSDEIKTIKKEIIDLERRGTKVLLDKAEAMKVDVCETMLIELGKRYEISTTPSQSNHGEATASAAPSSEMDTDLKFRLKKLKEEHPVESNESEASAGPSSDIETDLKVRLEKFKKGHPDEESADLDKPFDL